MSLNIKTFIKTPQSTKNSTVKEFIYDDSSQSDRQSPDYNKLEDFFKNSEQNIQQHFSKQNLLKSQSKREFSPIKTPLSRHADISPKEQSFYFVNEIPTINLNQDFKIINSSSSTKNNNNVSKQTLENINSIFQPPPTPCLNCMQNQLKLQVEQLDEDQSKLYKPNRLYGSQSYSNLQISAGVAGGGGGMSSRGSPITKNHSVIDLNKMQNNQDGLIKMRINKQFQSKIEELRLKLENSSIFLVRYIQETEFKFEQYEQKIKYLEDQIQMFSQSNSQNLEFRDKYEIIKRKCTEVIENQIESNKQNDLFKEKYQEELQKMNGKSVKKPPDEVEKNLLQFQSSNQITNSINNHNNPSNQPIPSILKTILLNEIIAPKS